MQRTSKLTTVVLVATLRLAACGGRTSHKTASPTGSTTSAGPTVSTTSAGSSGSTTILPVTTTSTSSVGNITKAACTLASAAQVQALLGLPPSSDGVEQDYQPTYKTCRWLTTPPPGGNTNALQVGVLQKSATSNGFAAPSDLGNPSPVAGVGDSATLYSTAPGATFAKIVLVAKKGPGQLVSRSRLRGNAGAAGRGPGRVGCLGPVYLHSSKWVTDE